jgi:UDP:flavonoid glycosyltransferase YjiC (YdhE family)
VKILIASLGAYGHLYPMMPLALACADAGHEVVVATGEPFLGRLPLPSVPAYPPELTLGWSFEETRRRHPELTGSDLSMAMFADVAAESVAPTVVEQCERLKPDLVVYEAMNTGAGVAASVLGIPAAAFAIGLATFIYESLHSATIGYQRDVWEQHNRTPPDASTLLAAALIDPSPAMLRLPGAPVPSAIIPIRPVAYNEETAAVPAWLNGPRARPRVYITLGTVSFGAVEVLERAVREVAALDIDALVTVGPEGEPAALGDLPGNVRVERFVAQSKVLPMVDLIVHHGGTGTVLSAIEAGLPQLILPQGADQFFNADTLTRVGAGRALLNDAQETGAIRASVEALLGQSPERQVAGQIRAEIAALPDPAAVVSALVSLTKSTVSPG